jgi:hypothetical protein
VDKVTAKKIDLIPIALRRVGLPPRLTANVSEAVELRKEVLYAKPVNSKPV